MRYLRVAFPLALLTMFSIMPSAHSLVFIRAFCDPENVDAVAEQMLRALGENCVGAKNAERANAEPSEDELVQMPVVDRPITSPFGYRIHPIFHRRIFHEGLDFRADLGEEVHCVLDGVVKFSGKRGGFGNAVYVYHPVANKTSMYAHMSSLRVKVGQVVKQGEIVGLAGSTGYSTGVHLHFGVKSAEGKWQDPLAFLKKVPHYELLAIGEREAAVIAAAPKGESTTEHSSQAVESITQAAASVPPEPLASAIEQQPVVPEVTVSVEPVKFPFGEPVPATKQSLSTLILLREVAREKIAPVDTSTKYGADIAKSKEVRDGENNVLAQVAAMDVHTQVSSVSAPAIAPSPSIPSSAQGLPKGKSVSLTVRLLLSSIKSDVSQVVGKS